MTTSDQYDVFISYRRKDSRDKALAIADMMEQEPRLRGRVFIDRAIEAGQDFEQRILGALNQCNVMVVVIGKEWAKTAEGRERIREADDWVRREVEFGLNRGKDMTIFPILVNGATPLTPTDVPDTFYRLTKLHTAFEVDAHNLILQIRDLLLQQDGQIELIEQQKRASLEISRPPKPRWIPLGAATIVVIAVILAIIFILQGIDNPKEDSQNTATPPPEASSLVEALAHTEPPVPVVLNDISPDLSALAVAPRNGQPILWGYGSANGQPSLYAVDAASGRQIPPLEADSSLTYPLTNLAESGNAFVPSLLYSDDNWLWVGSLQEQRVVALDPSTLQPALTWDDLQGQPIDMARAGQNLWVLTDAPAGLESAQLSPDNTNLDYQCDLDEAEVKTPIAIAAEGRGSVWIIYGGREDGSLRSVSAENCQTVAEIPLGGQPNDLVISDGFVWMIVDGNLLRVATENDETAEPVELGLTDFKFVTAVGNGKLLLTHARSLFLYDIASGRIEQNLSISGAQTVVQFGAQTWVASENDELLQYVIPRYTHPNLVDMVRVGSTLWAIDEDSQLCAFNSADSQCYTLTLDDQQPLALAYHDENTLWVSTGKTIWQVNLTTGEVVQRFSLDSPAVTMVEDTSNQRLWVSNTFGLLGFFSLAPEASQAIQNITLGPTERPPNFMAYRTGSLWFAFDENGTSRIVSVTYNTESNTLSKFSELELPLTMTDLQIDADRVYVATQGLIYLIDRSDTNRQIVLGAGKNLEFITGDSNGLWASNPTYGMIYEMALPEE